MDTRAVSPQTQNLPELQEQKVVAFQGEERQRKMFKIKRQKKIEENALEKRLDTISELTRGLGKSEFNNLIEAVKSVYEARQKLLKVKTDDEKEVAVVDEIESQFNLTD